MKIQEVVVIETVKDLEHFSASKAVVPAHIHPCLNDTIVSMHDPEGHGCRYASVIMTFIIKGTNKGSLLFIDFLISGDSVVFVVHGCGVKDKLLSLRMPPSIKEVDGVLHYYGYDLKLIKDRLNKIIAKMMTNRELNEELGMIGQYSELWEGIYPEAHAI